ncbi:MAG: hypothetical protein JST21_09065 [Bacteroidetes bacterium]|nr:hypothetical protein [Bacteroidota bacterium]
MLLLFIRIILVCISIIKTLLLTYHTIAKTWSENDIHDYAIDHNRNINYSDTVKLIAPVTKIFFALLEKMDKVIITSIIKWSLKTIKSVLSITSIIQAKGAIILNGVYIFKSDKVDININDINFFVSNTSKRRCYSWQCLFFKFNEKKNEKKSLVGVIGDSRCGYILQ